MTDSNPEIRSRECPQCLLCGSQGKELYAGLADRLFGAPGVWSVRQCCDQNCGLSWLDPMPLAADIGLAYKYYYTHQEIAVGHNKNLGQVVLDSLRKVLAAVSGLNVMKLTRVHQYLGDLPGGKLLDVGCGAGGYLNLMRSRGWSVEGVDFDAEAARHAREKYNIKVYSGQLEDMNFHDGSFDAITMNHLIEHVYHPIKLLQECRRLLKPGGRLVIITPNSKSLGHAKFAKNWRGLEPPRHLHIFSAASLRKLSTQAGFGEVDIFTTAANAEGVFRGSLGIKKAERRNTQGKDETLSVFERLMAVFMQFEEALCMKAAPEAGEEVVMICRVGRGS